MSESDALKDVRVLVSGGSGAIGSGIAIACARQGARLLLGFHHHEARAQNLATELRERYGVSAVAHPIDVSAPATLRAAVSAAADLWGGLDAVVHAAGVMHPGLLVTQKLELMAQTLAVNLLGAAALSQAALPTFLRQRAGVVITISSIVAARPFRGQALYAASKAGLEGLTRAMAVEYGAKGIRALCLRPGPIAGGMLDQASQDAVVERVPLGRVGSPADIGELVAFCLSPKAAYLNGAVLSVDGGMSVA